MRDFALALPNVQIASVSEVNDWLQRREILLIDVREPHEFEAENIPGAVLLPLSRFEADSLPVLPGTRIVVHCMIGKRSEAAAKMLIKAGHAAVFNMEGGLNAWKDAGFEIDV